MGLADEVERFIRQARVARLATVDEAGQPLVVPICFAWDGTALYSAVDAKPKRTRELRRLQNIRANPKVSVVIDHYEGRFSPCHHKIVTGSRLSVNQSDPVVLGRINPGKMSHLDPQPLDHGFVLRAGYHSPVTYHGANPEFLV